MRWAVGTLLSVLLVISGYTYRATDDRTFANQLKIEKLRQDLTATDADLQQEKVRTDIQYKELERRLTNIEKALERIEEQLQRHRF